jgi:hypothetical protein
MGVGMQEGELMERQERKVEREFGLSIMNFSCNEILKNYFKKGSS